MGKALNWERRATPFGRFESSGANVSEGADLNLHPDRVLFAIVVAGQQLDLPIALRAIKGAALSIFSTDLQDDLGDHRGVGGALQPTQERRSHTRSLVRAIDPKQQEVRLVFQQLHQREANQTARATRDEDLRVGRAKLSEDRAGGPAPPEPVLDQGTREHGDR